MRLNARVVVVLTETRAHATSSLNAAFSKSSVSHTAAIRGLASMSCHVMPFHAC